MNLQRPEMKLWPASFTLIIMSSSNSLREAWKFSICSSRGSGPSQSRLSDVGSRLELWIQIFLYFLQVHCCLHELDFTGLHRSLQP